LKFRSVDCIASISNVCKSNDFNPLHLFLIYFLQYMVRKRLSRKNAVYTPASTTTVMVNYSDALNILEVEFKGGRIYHYFKVDPLLWEEYKSVIQSNGSSGKFVNIRIKPFHQEEEIMDR
jgi:KTSC domain